MKTLESRLVLRTVAGTAVLMIGFSFAVNAFVKASLRSEFDQALKSKALALTALAEQERGNLEFDGDHLPEFQITASAEYYEIWSADGEVIARSASLGQNDLPLSAGSIEEPAFGDVVLPDGRAGRVVGLAFVPQQEAANSSDDGPLSVTLVVGRSTDSVTGILSSLRSILTILCTAAIVVAALILRVSVRQGLAPVQIMTEQIAAIGEQDLSMRIDPGALPAELAPVIRRLNELLSRLELAFGRERAFSANVAHELRTPLAGMRSTLEVALMKERDPEAYRSAMATCLAISQDMYRMVECLLTLARADAGQITLNLEAVDVAAVLRSSWIPLETSACARKLGVEWQLNGPCIVQTDRDLLRLIVHNVLHNAVTYADEGGRISIAVNGRAGEKQLIFSNPASTMTAKNADHVFDRFWRGDRARQAAGRHCGLGLSLCKTITQQLGGSIEARASNDGVFTVSISLPSK